MKVTEPTPRRALSLILALALARTLVSVFTHRGYGIFRDELYYIACSEHLAAGYVDHPPLVALLAWLARALGGDSLFALRLVPALLAGATVFATGLLVRTLGGGAWAVALAAVAVGLAPLFSAFAHVFSMNAVEPLLWTLAALMLVRLVDGVSPRHWLAFGALCGIGLLNKHSMLFFGVGCTCALLVIPALRRQLRTPWPYAAFALAVALFAPNLAWEVRHGFPTLEFMDNARAHKNLALAPLAFLSEQVLEQGPLMAPVWLAGLVHGVRSERARPLAVIYLTLLAIFLATHAKPYYLGAAYPMLFAAGAITVERTARWLVRVAVAVALVSGCALFPLTVPVLDEEHYEAYAAALGVAPSTGERKAVGRLPQFFADMHGWEQLAEDVARVYHAQPESKRGGCAIFGNNYGEAGAIDHFGPRLGLPRAIAGHNSYWMWGPGPTTGECVLVIGGERDDHLRSFGRVEAAGESRDEWRMPYENVTIWVLREPRMPVAALWRHAKHYD